MPSIFISHSWKERDTVDRFKAKLASRGYHSLFIDYDAEHGIPAGSIWERELYRNLKLSGGVIVLCSPNSMASRWCFAEITQARALGKTLFPVVVAPCRADTLRAALFNDHQIIDLTASGEDEAFARLFRGLKGAGLDPSDNFDWDPSRPPFPGFDHFKKEDAGIFFGRDEEIRGVIDKLNALKIKGEPRFLILAGPSGSGKSSVVRAGVIPRLARDPSRWVVVDPLRREGDPIAESARAVAALRRRSQPTRLENNPRQAEGRGPRDGSCGGRLRAGRVRRRPHHGACMSRGVGARRRRSGRRLRPT